MAMSRQKKLDKMDVIELAAEKPKPEFHFKQGRTPGKYIFETKDLVIGYDEPLSRPLTLSMERGQKIALVGANGIGKTTLLKSILGLIPSLKGTRELGDNLQIGYFEQEVKGDNKTTCIDEIWAEFPLIPSMKYAPHLQNVVSPPSILRVKSVCFPAVSRPRSAFASW